MLKKRFTRESPLKFLVVIDLNEALAVSPSTRADSNAFILVTLTRADGFPFTLDEFIYESV
jgi:hypothetical protein